MAILHRIDSRIGSETATSPSNFLMQIPNFDQGFTDNSQYCFNIRWKFH